MQPTEASEWSGRGGANARPTSSGARMRAGSERRLWSAPVHSRRLDGDRWPWRAFPAEPFNDVLKMQEISSGSIARYRRFQRWPQGRRRQGGTAAGVDSPDECRSRALSQQPKRVTSPRPPIRGGERRRFDRAGRSGPCPATKPVSLGESIDEVIGVSVRGLSGKELDNVVRIVADQQRRQKDVRPVFLTDCPDFHAFARRGYAFEYLSKISTLHQVGRGSRPCQQARGGCRQVGLLAYRRRSDARALNRNYPPLAAIIQHNSGMSKACHHDRFEWITEMLRLALVGERYEVAGGLSDYLLAFYDGLPRRSLYRRRGRSAESL